MTRKTPLPWLQEVERLERRYMLYLQARKRTRMSTSVVRKIMRYSSLLLTAFANAFPRLSSLADHAHLLPPFDIFAHMLESFPSTNHLLIVWSRRPANRRCVCSSTHPLCRANLRWDTRRVLPGLFLAEYDAAGAGARDTGRYGVSSLSTDGRKKNLGERNGLAIG